MPFKVFSIGSGFLKFSFREFVSSAFVGRGLRFLSVAYLSSIFGELAIKIVEDNLLLTVGLLIVGALIVKVIKERHLM